MTTKAKPKAPAGQWPKFPFDPECTEYVKPPERFGAMMRRFLAGDWDEANPNWETVKAKLRAEHQSDLEGWSIDAIYQFIAVEGPRFLTLAAGNVGFTNEPATFTTGDNNWTVFTLTSNQVGELFRCDSRIALRDHAELIRKSASGKGFSICVAGLDSITVERLKKIVET